MKPPQIEGISFLRCIAAFAVVAAHVACKDFLTFSPQWFVVNIWDSAARFSVPVFFMISGYLLLGKTDEDILVFYAKSFKRVILPLLFFSMLLYQNPLDSPFTNLLAVLRGPVAFHLWYVYYLIGMYLLVPFMRIIVQSAPPRYLYILIGLCLFFDFILSPLQEHYEFDPSLIKTYNAYWFTGFIIYFYLGYLLRRVVVRAWSIKLLLLGVYGLSVFSIYLLTDWYSHKMGKPLELFYRFYSFPVAVSAVSLFLAFKDSSFGRARTLIDNISACSFGIYLFHIFFIGKFYYMYFYSPTMNRWIEIPLVSTIVFVSSYLIIFAARRIKFFRYVT